MIARGGTSISHVETIYRFLFSTSSVLLHAVCRDLLGTGLAIVDSRQFARSMLGGSVSNNEMGRGGLNDIESAIMLLLTVTRGSRTAGRSIKR